MKKAIILTGGLFETSYAKTAHGLVRGSERFDIVGIVDENNGGKLANEIVPHGRPVPVYSTLSDFFGKMPGVASHCIIGVATKGGTLPPSIRPQIIECISLGLHVVNGLHQLLSDDPELNELASRKGVEILDIRKPKPFHSLRFWDGSIERVSSYKIAVLGTDCAVGKRTTARFLTLGLREAGINAEMIYTGQTGWMQGANYGFIFDATLNDFISGELEGAIVDSFIEKQPRVILIEGQSGMRNPSGPCGAEFILSAAANAVILQIVPNRTYFTGLEDYPAKIPSARDEIKLIECYGVPVIALTVNTEGMSPDEALLFATNLEKEVNIPVVLPIGQGVGRLVNLISKNLEKHEN
ncbi:MAG TPA: DUF1611 domain-containing protein [Bacteroidales bacterium]|nr:DUF1611 domain-containing protein [Bacteroidales bacterium]